MKIKFLASQRRTKNTIILMYEEKKKLRIYNIYMNVRIKINEYTC